MKIRTFLLCTVTLTLGAYPAHAGAWGPRYVPRPDISQNNYTEENRVEDRNDTEYYEQYEQREPCQNYRKLPRNYISNCVREEEVVPVTVVETAVVTQPSPVVETEYRLLPIVRSYTVLFDFDKSGIRQNEIQTLDLAASEIEKYDPQQVTVTGYTDSSGPADYNQTLSREREQSVSQALLTRGIENQTLDRDARGEYDQAVKTADGTKNQENRRVVIDFRR